MKEKNKKEYWRNLFSENRYPSLDVEGDCLEMRPLHECAKVSRK
ncbi:hypothetical protein BREVNS_0008 [Brevinematales bacterium NS]|nr:hypothetical protein BREVNS_0008 [Brevinematales bacterium NS]